MSEGTSELTAPPAEPVETAPVEAPVETAPEPEEAVDGSITVPDDLGGTVMVPLSAATTARREAKTAKEEAKAAKEALAKIQGEWQQAAPYVEAAKAILAQPQAQPAPAAPTGPSPEEQRELEEVARDLDFYKTDGSLDLDRATRHQARVLKAAEKIAQQQVAPYAQQAKVNQAQAVLNTVKGWVDPATKEAVDPTILTNLWNRVAQQPGGLETLANQEAAMFIWGQALNLTRWQKAQQGGGAAPAPAQAPQAPPVFVETSGGGGTQPSLSSMELRAAKDMGMSPAEYLKAAAKAPRGM
jgi:hypothetical protein